MTNRPRQKLGKPTTPKLGKPTTLNPKYKSDTCGEPAMVVEMDRLFSCPECYIERLRDKLKVLDRAANYH